MFVTHLEAAIDGTHLPADRPQTLHKDRPLWVRYDLQAARSSLTANIEHFLSTYRDGAYVDEAPPPRVEAVFTRRAITRRPPTLWRYRELLPLPASSEPVTLGEGMSPMLPCPKLGARFGLSNLWIKDESQLPTGSFKSRGLCMAISMCKHFGIQRVAIPTAGNAGGAMAAYAARAGMEAYVFMPDDTPAINQYECALAGAKTFLVRGLINDCGKIVREGKERMGWFDLSTLKEPYRIEGKKTMGLELAEQLDWKLPDVILYPTGGGTGLIGMWKAFAELAELGWIETDKRPRMVAVQSDGCAPIVRAFDAGAKHAELFPNAATIASGLRVPAAVGDFMILDAVRASGGRAIAVAESRIREWMKLAVASEGIAVCPEAAACVGALEQLTAEGWIKPDEQVVLFNTGAVQKYPEAMSVDLPRLDHTGPIDWDALS